MQCPVAPSGEGDGTRRFSRVFSSDLSSGGAAGSWALLLPFLFCMTLLLELPFWKSFFGVPPGLGPWRAPGGSAGPRGTGGVLFIALCPAACCVPHVAEIHQVNSFPSQPAVRASALVQSLRWVSVINYQIAGGFGVLSSFLQLWFWRDCGAGRKQWFTCGLEQGFLYTHSTRMAVKHFLLV